MPASDANATEPGEVLAATDLTAGGATSSRPRLARRTVLLGALAVSLSACGRSGGADAGYITGEGVVEQIAPQDRRPLPAITGRTLEGGTFDSGTFEGKVLVVNIWGSWCPPCRKEAPGLRKVWEDTRARGVQFVGIDVRDNDAAGLAFERGFGITYPSIRTDDSGAALLALGSVLPRNAIPSTVITDRTGKVAARVVGRTTYTTLKELVESVLAEKEGRA